jgi:hypothetical protein
MKVDAAVNMVVKVVYTPEAVVLMLVRGAHEIRRRRAQQQDTATSSGRLMEMERGEQENKNSSSSSSKKTISRGTNPQTPQKLKRSNWAVNELQ